ncbi:MAG: hypothetical protein NTX59_10875 [Elusimicrobia bacterium]|nr:hypothetical protein [Elusimicrobiota bacterium]
MLKLILTGRSYNQKLEYGPEEGEFVLMIGSSAADIRLRAYFELVKGV